MKGKMSKIILLVLAIGTTKAYSQICDNCSSWYITGPGNAIEGEPQDFLIMPSNSTAQLRRATAEGFVKNTGSYGYWVSVDGGSFQYVAPNSQVNFSTGYTNDCAVNPYLQVTLTFQGAVGGSAQIGLTKAWTGDRDPNPPYTCYHTVGSPSNHSFVIIE